MRKILLALCACLTAASAMASEAVAPPPPLAAHYETSACGLPCDKPVERRWFLLRGDAFIELRDQIEPVSQLWRRHADGRIDYTYVMHDERRAIEYTIVDLKLIGHTPDWERLGSLLSARDLAALSTDATNTGSRTETRRYEGAKGPARIEVTWNPTLALPERLSYRYPSHTVTVRLLASYDLSNAPVRPTDPQTLAGYSLVDFADLGDMEEDPQAQSWIRKALRAPGHEGHAHAH